MSINKKEYMKMYYQKNKKRIKRRLLAGRILAGIGGVLIMIGIFIMIYFFFVPQNLNLSGIIFVLVYFGLLPTLIGVLFLILGILLLYKERIGNWIREFRKQRKKEI